MNLWINTNNNLWEETMTTTEKLELIEKLKERGVIHYKDKDFEVHLDGKTYQSAPFKEESTSKVTLDDELFNQGI